MNNKNLIWPESLNPGDKVALTAPSSPVSNKVLSAATDSLVFLGLKPVVMPSCTMHHGYLAGSDVQRAKDVNTAFADKTIKGVFCLRGGYGAMRILPLLDFETIRNNPKVFVGYSDITALHTVFNNTCGFITFHGPMPSNEYTQIDDFTLKSLTSYIFHDKREIINPSNENMKVLLPGRCHGILTGGNLSLLVGTLGTPYEIDTKSKILFIEEVDERPYRIDKSLTQLALAGKFRDCNGIILGAFTGCGTSHPLNSLSFETVVDEIVLSHNKPIVSNLRAGHIHSQTTLPLGAPIELDLNNYENPKINVL